MFVSYFSPGSFFLYGFFCVWDFIFIVFSLLSFLILFYVSIISFSSRCLRGSLQDVRYWSDLAHEQTRAADTGRNFQVVIMEDVLCILSTTFPSLPQHSSLVRRRTD